METDIAIIATGYFVLRVGLLALVAFILFRVLSAPASGGRLDRKGGGPQYSYATAEVRGNGSR